MGLDVYLYHSTDRAAAKVAEDEYERRTEALWGAKEKYEDYTEAEKDDIRSKSSAIATELGCTGEYNSHHTVTKISRDSAKYPKHYFKLGYLRSSYNDSGINRVLGNLGIPTLNYIFEAGGEYEFTPDWRLSLERVEEVISKYRAYLESPLRNIRIMKISHNMFRAMDEYPPSEEAAMGVFQKQVEQHGNRPNDAYGNIEGDFWLGGLTVYGIMPGLELSLAAKLYSGKDRLQGCVYIAYKAEQESEDANGEDWYLAALEITKETIEFVLATPDPQNYYLHWSS